MKNMTQLLDVASILSHKTQILDNLSQMYLYVQLDDNDGFHRFILWIDFVI